MVHYLFEVNVSFFGPYLASLNLTSSSVSVGCFIAILGARRLGWLAGFPTTRLTDPLSSWQCLNILINRNGRYFYFSSTFTGSECQFLVPLLYFLAYLNFSSAVFAWGQNTWMLWSIAARETLATSTKYLLNQNNKIKPAFKIILCVQLKKKCPVAFKKPCYGKYWYHVTEFTSLWSTSMLVLH